MEVTCSSCQGNGSSGGVSCTVCGGDGQIDLTDANFKQIHLGDQIALTGQVWSDLLTAVADIEDKVNDVMDKCNDIMEKLNE